MLHDLSQMAQIQLTSQISYSGPIREILKMDQDPMLRINLIASPIVSIFQKGTTVVLRKRGKLRWLAEKSRSQAAPGAKIKLISQVHNSGRSKKILGCLSNEKTYTCFQSRVQLEFSRQQMISKFLVNQIIYQIEWVISIIMTHFSSNCVALISIQSQCTVWLCFR